MAALTPSAEADTRELTCRFWLVRTCSTCGSGCPELGMRVTFDTNGGFVVMYAVSSLGWLPEER